MKSRKIILLLLLVLIFQSSFVYAQVDPNSPSFAGKWDTHFSWSTGSSSTVLTCTQDGNSVHCDYDYDAGYLDGMLQDDGRTLEGTWKESAIEGVSGGFVFVLAEDGNSFTGEWWNDGNIGGGPWSGTRIGGGSGNLTPTITPDITPTITETVVPAITPTSEQEQVSIEVQANGFAAKVFTFTSTEPISVLEFEGYVVDDKGNGIAGATVSLLDWREEETTGPNGYFYMSIPGGVQGEPFKVSQNYELLPLLFTAETLEKDAYGNSYTGIVEDGVSFLTLQINIPAGADPNKVSLWCNVYPTFVMEQEGYRDPCSAPSVQGDIIETIVTPMGKFLSPYDITISVAYLNDDGSSGITEVSTINVIHPPVVLIHGIWASNGAMMPLYRFLDNTGHFSSFLLLADYSTTSSGDMRGNVAALRNSVNAAFGVLALNGYYGQRVDIVAHSLGGLISRMYMLGYTAADGSVVPGQAQKIRKLITLSTPHMGAPLGDWYKELDPPGMFDCPPYGFGFIWEGTHEPFKDEYEYILNEIRSAKSLRSDAFAYGEGARQLAVNNNPVLDELNAKQRAVGNQQNEFYFLAGNKAFANKWFGWIAAALIPRNIYPYHPASEDPPVDAKVGPCGQTEMPESFEKMLTDFISFTTADNTDGVVPVLSSFGTLGSTTGIQPLFVKTVPFDHLAITDAGMVWKDVYTFLIGGPPKLNGSFFFKGSPGTLHVYDDQGRHVGPDEIGIPGATYEEFESVTGGHTLIYVPDDGQFTVNVDVAEAGKVTLEVNQGGADGWRWTRYEDIAVESASHIELNYDRDNPKGQAIHANGETISLVPTYHEIISNVPADPVDEILTGMGSGLQSLWLIGFLVLAFTLGLGAILILWLVLRNRGKLQPAAIHAGDQYQRVQDPQGRSWYQDPNTGIWAIWNGTAWQPAPGTVPNIAMPISTPPSVSNVRDRKPGISSCLFTIVALVILGLLVVGGISLVAFNFFPGTQIQTGQGDLTEILKKGGSGLLVTILGMFLLNGGFKAISTRRAVVTDEWGRQREKRGCSAILNGLGQLFFGVICLSGGLGLVTLAFYQEILPWLGF
jgi:pimeloyl-ACP methyl ester carboxylesterase